MTRRVLLAPDARRRAGLGHLQRCLALAAALRKEGMACTFATAASPEAVERIRAAGFPFLTLSGEAPGGGPGPWLQPAWDDVVVDGYAWRSEDIAAVQRVGARVVHIDDLAAFATRAEVVVNPGVGASPAAYDATASRLLLGPTYALLRDEYWALPRRTYRPSVEQALLVMGGADGAGLLPKLLPALTYGLPGTEVVAVCGPAATSRPAVAEAVAGTPRCRLVDAPGSLRDLLLEADLVVTAAGQTLHEAAATGTPAVAVQVAANQAAHLAGFARAGVVEPVVAGPESFVDDVAAAARRLAGDRRARERMGGAGRSLVDGRGALRVAAVLAEGA